MAKASYSFSTTGQSDLLLNTENECALSNAVCFELPKKEYTNLTFLIRSISNVNHNVFVAIFDESTNEWVHSQDIPINANNDEWQFYADYVYSTSNVNMLKIYTTADDAVIDIQNGFIMYNYTDCSNINNENDCITSKCYWCNGACQDTPCGNNGDEDNSLIYALLIIGGLGAGIIGYYYYKKKHKT